LLYDTEAIHVFTSPSELKSTVVSGIVERGHLFPRINSQQLDLHVC